MSAMKGPSPSFMDQLLFLDRKTNEAGMNNIKSIIEWINAGETLLHIAAKYGKVEITRLLIEFGANVNAQDNKGKTPIMLAVENKPDGFLDVVDILCKSNANIHTPDKCGKTAAQLVLSDSNLIIDYASKVFLDTVHRECNSMSEKTAKKLFELNCPLWRAVLLENSELIEHMILCGSPVDSRHPVERYTALHQAVKFLQLETVRVLIEYNADVDLCDDQGCLPIAHCGIYDLFEHPEVIQHREIVRLLLDKTVLLKDLNGENIRQLRTAFACGSAEVIRIFLDYQKDILNIADRERQTPMHYLSANYHSDITELLRDQNVNVNVRDAQGRTPLFSATQYSFSHINTYKFLLENRADVNAIEYADFEVPLFSLCQNLSIAKETYFKIVQTFLQYDLDVQYVMHNQTTVFDVILKSGSFYMAEPLLAHLAILDDSKKPVVESIRLRIDSCEIFKECFDVCKAELAKMKSSFVNGKVTLHMILVDEVSEKQIVNICIFDAGSLSKLEKLKNEFCCDSNYYHVTVCERISSIVSKLKLMLKAITILSKLVGLTNNPYHIAVMEIAYYLDDKDLQNLIKV